MDPAGAQPGGPSSGLICCGKARCGCSVPPMARSAAPPLSSSRRHANAMLWTPHDQAGLEQGAGRVRLGTAVDEMVDQHHRRPHRPDHKHGDESDREQTQLPRAARDRAWIGGDHSDEQHALDRREHPPRAQPNVSRKECRQDHRGDDRAHHRPARLPSHRLAAPRFHPSYPRAATPEVNHPVWTMCPPWQARRIAVTRQGF